MEVMFHVMVCDPHRPTSVSSAHVRSTFSVPVPGDPSVTYRIDGIQLVDPHDYLVEDLRVAGRSQFVLSEGALGVGMPGEVFASHPGQVTFDLAPGGSTIDVSLTCIGDRDRLPDCTITLTVVEVTRGSVGT